MTTSYIFCFQLVGGAAARKPLPGCCGGKGDPDGAVLVLGRAPGREGTETPRFPDDSDRGKAFPRFGGAPTPKPLSI